MNYVTLGQNAATATLNKDAAIAAGPGLVIAYVCIPRGFIFTMSRQLTRRIVSWEKLVVGRALYITVLEKEIDRLTVFV